MLIATPKLLQVTSQYGDASIYNPTQLLFVAYLESTYGEVDGVWWEDNYSLDCYSAPRGVIFNSQLKSWDTSIGLQYPYGFGNQSILDCEEDYELGGELWSVR